MHFLSALPKQYDEWSELIERAFRDWAPKAEIRLDPLTGGLSGALVFRVDVRQKAKSKTVKGGLYILKLCRYSPWKDVKKEQEAHQEAYERSKTFSSAHIPRLVAAADYPDLQSYAMLFEIAGLSLNAFIPVDRPESDNFFRVADRVVQEALAAWTDPAPSDDLSAEQLLRSWLGYRLDPKQAPELHDFVDGQWGKELVVRESWEFLINPIAFIDYAASSLSSQIPCLSGVIHGDLHGGNLLVHRSSPETHPYWIIDFGLSRTGCVGFDQAYLEMAHIKYALSKKDPTFLVRVLARLESDDDVGLLPGGTKWIYDCLKVMRQGIRLWQEATHPSRADDIRRQFTLARVAAGLNWANKQTLDKEDRYLALVYAGWAAREYLKLCEPEAWQDLASLSAKKGTSTSGSAATGPAGHPSAVNPMNVNVLKETISEGDRNLLSQMWSEAGNFQGSAARFILVAEAQRIEQNPELLKAVGQLPWSAVIDLDPDSDRKGLHYAAAPILQTHRGLHHFSQKVPTVDYFRGTAWMMAAGWQTKDEPSTDYFGWTAEKLEIIRHFARALEHAFAHLPVYVIALPGGSLDKNMPQARLTKVLGAISEASRNRANILSLGANPISEPLKNYQHFPVPVSSFLLFLEHHYGHRARTDEIQIPAADNQWKTLPLGDLRTIEENFEVLHSKVLEERQEYDSTDLSQFWRGAQPSWFDFKEGRAIERDVQRELEANIRAKLAEGRRYTLIFQHHPGAGGTTVALSAAWTFHREYPTIVLRHRSPAIATRVQHLYNMAQKPILMVAESHILPESEPIELFRTLARNNVPIVLLYVKKQIERSEMEESEMPEMEEVNPLPTRRLWLESTMSREESEKFRTVYAQLTDDERRKEELDRITSIENLKKYRTPFFYGLITFEEEFLRIDQFVSTLLKGSNNKKVNELLEYIAMLTIYSNAGLPEVVIRRLLDIRDDSDLSIAELMGEGPAKLLMVQHGEVRIMHRVLAEEVLSILTHSEGDQWKQSLRYIASDLIKDVTSEVDAESDVVHEMFRQLFVDRYDQEAEEMDNRQAFSPLIEEIDKIDPLVGHKVFETLTEYCPGGAHFWNHYARHHLYRINRDNEKALEYIERAISLQENDYIHYHVKGVVLRSFVRDLARKVFRNKDPEALDLIRNTQHFFDLASEAFNHSRKINPENIYSYITHAQLILELAKDIKKVLKINSIGEAPQIDQVVSNWLFEQIPIVEDLLMGADEMQGEILDMDPFVVDCQKDLRELYGEIDEAIRLLEIVNAGMGANNHSRRTLANAYLIRHSRKWSQMSENELRVIKELMDQNLRSGGALRRDSDFRYWFEAYKLLPEFDMDEALATLSTWAQKSANWRAFYYSYLLRFVLWFTDRDHRLDEMFEAQQRCQENIIGRKNFSTEWWGGMNPDCPLVSSAELEPWDKKKKFWENENLLLRINGVIDDTIDSPAAGKVIIGGKIEAFFVPATGDFQPNRDENQPVNFYVGFSPVGLRAWDVKRGHIAGGDPHHLANKQDVELFFEKSKNLAENRQQVLAATYQFEKVLQFSIDFLRSQSNRGTEIRGEDLLERVMAAHRLAEPPQNPEGKSLLSVLRGMEEVIAREEKNKWFFSLKVDQESLDAADELPVSSSGTRLGQIVAVHYDQKTGMIQDAPDHRLNFRFSDLVAESRGLPINRHGLVEFVPAKKGRGARAISIKLLSDGHVLDLELQRLHDGFGVRQAVADAVFELLSEEKQINLKALSDRIMDRFRGGNMLTDNLQVKKIGEFFNSLPGIEIKGEFPNLMVSMATLTPGKMPNAKEKPKAKTEKAKEKTNTKPSAVGQTPTKQQVYQVLVDWLLGQKKTSGVPLPIFSSFLRQAFPQSKELLKSWGHTKVLPFLQEIPQLLLTKDDKHGYVVTLADKGKSSEVPSPASSVDRTAVIREILRFVADNATEEQAVAIGRIGLHCSKKFQLGTELYKIVGVKKLSELLEEIPELELVGDDPVRRGARLREGVELTHPEADPPSATVSKDELFGAIRKFVQQKLAEGEIAWVDRIWEHCNASFEGETTIYKALGYKKFIQVFSDIPEMEIFWEDPTQKKVRLAKGTSEAASEEE